MKNDIEKLTGMEGKSYHGNMTENDNEIKKDAPKEPVGDGKVPENFKQSAEVQNKAGEQGNKAVGERKEEPKEESIPDAAKREISRRINGEPDNEQKEERKGLFDIFLDFLKAFFGVEDKEAQEMIDNSEAMRGVQAYWRIKPQNKWDKNDYARVIFMLNGDGSKEATAVKDQLYKDAEDKGMPKDKIKIEDKDRAREAISYKVAELEEKHSGILGKEGKAKPLTEQEKKAEMVQRAIAMNVELWRETGEGVLKLGKDKLEEVEKYYKSLNAQGDEENEKKAYLIKASQMAIRLSDPKSREKYYSGGSGEKEEKNNEEGGETDKERKEEQKFQEGFKKAREAFNKFSLENQKIIREKLKSGDPEYFKHLFKVLEKYKGDPKYLKRAADNYLEAYEYNVKHGFKLSENVERVADLMKDVLFELDMSGEGVQSGAKNKIEKEEVHQDEGQDRFSDQGGKKDTMGGQEHASSAEVDEDEGKNEKNEAQDSKAGGGKGKGEKPVSIMNDKELQAHYLKLINKNTGVLPEILQVNKDMLAELVEIRKSIGEMVGSYMKTIVDYPDKLRSNPEEYKNMRREYITQREREIEIQSHLDKFTKGEKRVLGGEKDKGLYVGNINEVLEERMKRIEYFTAREANGGIDWGKLGKDSLLNPDASGITNEEKIERQKFFNGMKVRYDEFKNDGVLAKQEGLYFQEIQRWVGEILENSQYGTRGDRKHDLILPDDVYKQFSDIKVMPAYVYEHGSQEEYENKLLEKVKILRDKKFLDYFKGASYLNFEGKDITRETGEIGRASMGYPSSIEATMLLIAEDRGAEYRTGAEHELIDASGKFHQENFIYWMRKEMNKLTDWDPWSPIDPMRGITFKAGFSQISLFDILFLPQYTQHQEIEIHGRVNDKGDPDVHSNWGEKKDHPDMDYDTRVNRILIDEPWLYGIEHNDNVQLYNYQARSNPEKYLEVKGAIAQSNNYARSGLWLRRLMLPSHSGHEGKDTENYLKKKKQGKMGEAVDAGQLFYRYLTDFTEKYLDKKEEKATGVRENNMAYNALDKDGSSVFLTSIAESALGMADVGAEKEIKRAYGNFILDRIGDIEEKYKRQGDEGKKKILIEKCREEVRKLRDEDQGKLKISFDTFDKLTDLQMKLETVALKKIKLSAEEKKKAGLKDDSKVVVKEEVEKKVKEKMRENIGVFLTKVMAIEIPEANDKGKFDLDEKGKPKRTKKIGDFEMFMDGNGRIVTEKEWEEMDDKGKIKKTFGQIMEEDLGVGKKGFARDSSKLEEYGEAVSDFEKAMEEGKETKSIEEKIARLGGECRGVFERRERLGLAMLTKVANIERKTLNFWTTTRPWEDSARKLVKDALMKTIGVTYDLDSHEQLYAHDRIWYPMEYTEVAAFNNTSRVIGGVQMGTQYSQLDEARKNYQGLSTMGGSLETIDEMKSLRLPSLFERLKIKKRGEGLPDGIPQHSLIEIMQGGEGAVIKPRHLRKIEDNPDEIYETPKDWEHADVIDGLSHIEQLRKLIVEENTELGSFHEIVTINAWGVMKVDYAKARKLFDAYWNHARLTFGSHQIDYGKKIWAHGREMTVQDYFFGERTQKTQDRMEKYYVEMAGKATEKGKAEDAAAYKKMASDLKNKPALAFVMNMVTSGIHEHMTFDSPYEMWSTQHVQEIAWIMEESFRQVSDNPNGKNGEHKKGLEPAMKPSMMPYELFNRLLGVQEGDSMDWFMFKDLFLCLVSGIIEGVGMFGTEMEDEIVQVKKIYKGG